MRCESCRLQLTTRLSVRWGDRTKKEGPSLDTHPSPYRLTELYSDLVLGGSKACLLLSASTVLPTYQLFTIHLPIHFLFTYHIFYSTLPSIHHPPICSIIYPTPPLRVHSCSPVSPPSTYLFTYPSLHLLYRNLSHPFINTSLHPPICSSSIYWLTCPSIHYPPHPLIAPRDSLFTHPPTQLPPIYHLFIYYPSTHLSIHHPSAYSLIHLLPYFHSSDQSSDPPITSISFHSFFPPAMSVPDSQLRPGEHNREQTVNVHCDEVSARGCSMAQHPGPGLRARLSRSVSESATS